MMTDVAVPPPAAPSGPSPEELQAKFDELCRQVQDSPLNADLRARMGYAALELGRRMEAIGAFVRALQIDPSLSFLRARLRDLCTPEELRTFKVPEEVTPFWKDVPGLLAWPLRGKALGMLILGTVFISAMSIVAQFGVGGWFVSAILSGYLSAYYVGIVKSAGLGQMDPPEWPDISHPSDIIGYAVNWFVAGLACFFPAIIVSLLPDLDANVRLLFLGACGVWGVFLYPMAILVMALYGSGWSVFNYPFVVRSIMRVMSEYLLAWAVLFALALVVVGVVLLGGVLGLGAATAGGNLGTLVLVYLLYTTLSSALTLYGYTVFCRLLGQVYYFGRSKLGWFEEEVTS